MKKFFSKISYFLILQIMSFGLVNNIAHAEKRVALVIGNSTYEFAGTLVNPLNDATDMAASLENLGFEVVLGVDLKYDTMRNILKQFSESLVGADVALFFYAGHAVQVKGTNYLAPIDTDIERESDLEFETVALDVVQKLMEREAKTQLVFLDACRNNPLTRQLLRRTRSVNTDTGLARQELSAEGSYIAFATQPGNVALDGKGRNSPFTSALLKNLKRPGIEISALMTDVRRDVYESTAKQQLPWTNSGLLGRFYFSPLRNSAVETPNNVNTENSARFSNFERERARWNKIKGTQNPAIIGEFMVEFPDSVFTPLAQFKIDQLEVATRQQKELLEQSKKIKRFEELEQQRVAMIEQEEKNSKIKAESNKFDPKQIVSEQTIRSIQTEFNRLGCNAGAPDGKWGSNSINALSKYSKYGNKRFASTEPTIELYDDLRKQIKRICPIICGIKYNKKQNQCILKTCSGGAKLNSRGKCIKQTVRVKTQPVRQAIRKNTLRNIPNQANQPNALRYSFSVWPGGTVPANQKVSRNTKYGMLNCTGGNNNIGKPRRCRWQ